MLLCPCLVSRLSMSHFQPIFQKHEHFSHFSKNCSCFYDRVIPNNNPHFYIIVRVFIIMKFRTIIHILAILFVFL